MPLESTLPTLQVVDRFIAVGTEAALAALAPGGRGRFLLPRDRVTDYVKRWSPGPGRRSKCDAGLWIDGREVPCDDLARRAGCARWRLTLLNGRSYVVIESMRRHAGRHAG